MMTHLDDPRLTAYALGELDDDDDRAEVEALLARSTEARKFVEEIYETASTLRQELRAEKPMSLTDAQREPIEARLRKKSGIGFVWWVGAASAAMLALALFVPPWYSRSLPAPPPAVTPTPVVPAPPAEAPSPPAAPSDPAPTPRARLTAPLPRALQAPPVAIPDQLPADPGVEFNLPGGVEGGVPGGVIGGAPDSATLRSRSLGYLSGADPASPGLGAGFGGGAYSPGYADYTDVHRARPPFNTEAYDRLDDNPFLDVGQNPLSTFSIDVDTASLANVRRFITRSTRPPKDAVRIEELVNYFDYDYPAPPPGKPFSVNVELADAPWKPEHRLLRIGLKGTPLGLEHRPPLNLVFLLDVSGSMQPPNKLPLLQKAMRLLVDELTEGDQVAIVVYAGASGLVLPRTSGDQKQVILDALDRLRAGGSTNGGAGIQLAYDQAVAHFIPGGVNRVILATDGDFNVGVTNQGELTRLIEEKADSGVFLSVLGFGMGNYKDSTLEKLADRGNGNYAYIDSLSEARKVLVQEMGATLVTIAKDVKIQIEFNPAEASSYRLIGYENRLLRAEDFNDDQKDAGEIGAGHTVTALYEIVPAGPAGRVGAASPVGAKVDPLKYQRPQATSEAAASGELLTVKLRYKKPDGETSQLIERAVTDEAGAYARASEDFKFAAAVASYGMLLRDSPHKGNASLDAVLELAQQGLGPDRHGYRAEFIELVRRTKPLFPSN